LTLAQDAENFAFAEVKLPPQRLESTTRKNVEAHLLKNTPPAGPAALGK
jgi:hypothetical protein